ncbi:hypothetical protein JX266_001164 [Neoarthrinium moseri]|uniref:uncharacterized protein n=1 Tax=Neoarthrinium moseri TaxID=1658444 RepID=UPI001FDBEBAA|nr:uncharacterized protein JN550_002398 [Neoarthrinium moseri]KAI1854023.1 hypothetical protein JX266_001164 [Neoarthrinium moseri]KAI1874969.1 hypothetical protein JN550_002398 [Neoarthrinium moseri]
MEPATSICHIPGGYSVTAVTTPKDVEDTAALFQEYAVSLGIDLAFQGFDSELANLPGKYSPPTGCLLIGRSSNGEAIGCVGLRSLDADTSEMKRLYVSPSGRGSGLGKALAQQAVEQARRLGYRRIRLDSLRSMKGARALYAKLGFLEIEPYYNNPEEGACFLELVLR